MCPAELLGCAGPLSVGPLLLLDEALGLGGPTAAAGAADDRDCLFSSFAALSTLEFAQEVPWVAVTSLSCPLSLAGEASARAAVSSGAMRTVARPEQQQQQQQRVAGQTAGTAAAAVSSARAAVPWPWTVQACIYTLPDVDGDWASDLHAAASGNAAVAPASGAADGGSSGSRNAWEGSFGSFAASGGGGSAAAMDAGAILSLDMHSGDEGEEQPPLRAPAAPQAGPPGA